MTVQNASTCAGAYLQQQVYTTSPAARTVFNRSCLFKISQVGTTSRYILRSMLNNQLSITYSGTSVVTCIIPNDDADVPLANTFTITETTSGYTICPYGKRNIIGISPTSTANLQAIPSQEADNLSHWNIDVYIGLSKMGVLLPFQVPTWLVHKMHFLYWFGVQLLDITFHK